VDAELLNYLLRRVGDVEGRTFLGAFERKQISYLEEFLCGFREI